MRFRNSIVLTVALIIQSAALAAPSWNEATELFAKHDYVRACAEFEKLDEKSPGNASIHYMLGKCYRNMGQHKQAQSQFEWVAKHAPNAQTRQLAEESLEELGNMSVGTSSGHGSSSSSGQPPSGMVGGSPSAAVSAAAKLGYVPCKGAGCLNFGTPGWHQQHMEGYPDTDWWMDYKTADGTQYFSQHHIGHIIQDAKESGPCPVCRGTGWVKR
jgi:tetratricopeptide (TPR) repeat protein